MLLKPEYTGGKYVNTMALMSWLMAPCVVKSLGNYAIGYVGSHKQGLQNLCYLGIYKLKVMCCQTPNIRRTKSRNLNFTRLVLQLPLTNPLKPGVKTRMDT